MQFYSIIYYICPYKCNIYPKSRQVVNLCFSVILNVQTPQFCLLLSSPPRHQATTASRCPGPLWLLPPSTPCHSLTIPQTLSPSTTPQTPAWSSPAWGPVHCMPSRVWLGTLRAERERAVCTWTRPQVRRLWDTSVFLHWDNAKSMIMYRNLFLVWNVLPLNRTSNTIFCQCVCGD